MKSWVNGRTGGTIDIRDRGLNYGDGVFETMRIRRGAIRLIDHHLERLEDACRRLAITPPDAARLRAELTRAAEGRREGVLKLILTRGVGTRGYRPSGRERGTRVISLHPLSRTMMKAAAGSVKVRLCATRLGVNEALAGLKTLNRLESVLARAEWSDGRIWEGLMRDADDHIVCGTMSNFFVRRGARLMTPKVDRCGIAGVMRRWVLEQSSRLRLSASEVRLDWDDLTRADEAFMTNAIVGVVPIAVIADGRRAIRLKSRDTSRQLAASLERQ